MPTKTNHHIREAKGHVEGKMTIHIWKRGQRQPRPGPGDSKGDGKYEPWGGQIQTHKANEAKEANEANEANEVNEAYEANEKWKKREK